MMMMRRVRSFRRTGAVAFAMVALVATLGPAALASARSPGWRAPEVTPSMAPCVGKACKVHLKYVTDTMTVPISAAEARAVGFDLDGDGVADNALGMFFSVMADQNLDFYGALNSSIQSGHVVMLHSLVARALNQDAAATWRVYYGKPKASPVFDGTGRFAVDPAAPTSSKLIGPLTHRAFTSHRGTIPLRIAFASNQPVMELHLLAARIASTCTALRCTNGRLGGAIRKTEFNAEFYPALAALFASEIGPSCTESTPAECSDMAKNLLQIFDANHDYVITAQEMRDDSLIKAILAPDLDLFAANGKPGHDGVADSISLGLGFTAVKAGFALP
jgi:hypothetical protein